MGHDIAQGETWPIVMYGTDKQISSTPYLYAVFAQFTEKRVLAWKLAGLTFSLSGLWLVYETLLLSLLRKKRTSAVVMAAGWAFCLALSGSHIYLYSLADVSLTEQYHFCFGLQLYLLAIIQKRLDGGLEVPFWLWGALGCTLGYSYIVRPNAFLYGAAGGLMLLALYGKRLFSLVSVASVAIGLVAGYVPMLIHNMLRADTWPIGALVPPLRLCSLNDIPTNLSILLWEVLPELFLFHPQAPFLSAVLGFWCLLSLVGLAALTIEVFGSRDWRSVGIEGTLVLGTGFVIALMLLVQGVCVDAGSGRYCLALVPIVAWFVVVGLAGPRSWKFVVAVALMLAGFQYPHLKYRADSEVVQQELYEEAVRTLSQDYPDRLILARYWDGYHLDFMAGGRPRMLPFPFENTRLFGRYGRELQEQKPLWLIQEADLDVVRERLSSVPDLSFEEVGTLELLGRRYLLLETGPGTGADAFMNFHPNYFQPHPSLPGWASSQDRG